MLSIINYTVYSIIHQLHTQKFWNLLNLIIVNYEIAYNAENFQPTKQLNNVSD